MDLRELVNQLAAAQEAVNDTEILAPVLPGYPIRVRIAGVIRQLRLTDRSQLGWRVLRVHERRARPVREATRRERTAYLALLPSLRAIAVERIDETPAAWLAVVSGPLPRGLRLDARAIHVLLAEDEAIQPFDEIEIRWDGTILLYDRRTRRNPQATTQLREAYGLQVTPADLRFSGLTPDQRVAFGLAYERREQTREQTAEERIRGALAHAGATLVSAVERGAGYTVTYEVDGRRHTSNVDEAFTVQTAGICLSGQDRAFDLTSLVGVMRESHARRGGVPRVRLPGQDEPDTRGYNYQFIYNDDDDDED